MRFDAITSRRLDLFSHGGERLGPELARFAFQRMRGDHQRDGIMIVHRLLDGGEAFRPVLAEIGQNSDETRAKLRPALLEIDPVNDVRGVVHLVPCSQAPLVLGAVPRALPTLERVKDRLFSLVVEGILG